MVGAVALRYGRPKEGAGRGWKDVYEGSPLDLFLLSINAHRADPIGSGRSSDLKRLTGGGGREWDKKA